MRIKTFGLEPSNHEPLLYCLCIDGKNGALMSAAAADKAYADHIGPVALLDEHGRCKAYKGFHQEEQDDPMASC